MAPMRGRAATARTFLTVEEEDSVKRYLANGVEKHGHGRYSCLLCNKAQNCKNSNIFSHQCQHTGVRLEKCSGCDMRFAYPKLRQKHEEKEHGIVGRPSSARCPLVDFMSSLERPDDVQVPVSPCFPSDLPPSFDFEGQVPDSPSDETGELMLSLRLEEDPVQDPVQDFTYDRVGDGCFPSYDIVADKPADPFGGEASESDSDSDFSSMFFSPLDGFYSFNYGST